MQPYPNNSPNTGVKGPRVEKHDMIRGLCWAMRVLRVVGALGGGEVTQQDVACGAGSDPFMMKPSKLVMHAWVDTGYITREDSQSAPALYICKYIFFAFFPSGFPLAKIPIHSMYVCTYLLSLQSMKCS